MDNIKIIQIIVKLEDGDYIVKDFPNLPQLQNWLDDAVLP